MSSFRAKAINPLTNKEEIANFLDDYYGEHKYGVRFDDGKVYPEEQITRINN